MKKLKKNFRLLFIIGSLIMSIELNAQITTVNNVNCPFYIWNHRSCDVTVHYEVSDCNANIPITGPCGLGIVCSNISQVITASTQFFLSGGCCVQNPGAFISPPCNSPGGDIFVWLKEIDYVNITGGAGATQSVSGGNCTGFNLVGSGPTTGVASPCNLPNPYTITWSSSGVDIW